MNVKQIVLRMMRKKSDEGGNIIRDTEGEGGGGGEGDEEGEGKDVKEERKQKEKEKWMGRRRSEKGGEEGE